MAFDIDRPQHPLPEELTALTEEETQCKFCGISYLIHREVARLKDELEKAAADVARMADDIARVNEFKAELAAVNEARSQLTSVNEKLTAEKDEQAKIIVTYEEAKKREDEAKRTMKQHIVNFISNQRTKLDALKDEHIEHTKTTNQIVATVMNELTNQMNTMVSSLKTEHETEITKLNEQLTSSRGQVSALGDEKSALESELDRIKNDLDYVTKTKTTLDGELKTTQTELTTATAQGKSLKSELLRKVGEITQLKQQLAESSAGLSAAESTAKRLTGDYEGMKMRLEAENNAHRSKNTRLEAELANYQMELLEKDELLQTSVRLADFERVKMEQEASNAAFKSLEQRMNQTLGELDETRLRLSNEKTNYLDNIHTMEANFKAETGRYQMELDALKNGASNRTQLDELENDLEIEKEKSRGAIEMARLEISQAEERFRSVLADKDAQLEKSRQLHQREQDEQDCAIGELRARVAELETSRMEHESTVNELTKRLELAEVASTAKTDDAIKEQATLREQLNSKEEQITQLSNTIRKQVEERMELQATVEQLKNKGDGEVIMLPIASRLKAASLPPIEQRRPKLSPTKAWGGSSTTSTHDDLVRKSTSAPTVKKKSNAKSSNLNMSSIRKRLNLAMNRS